MQKAKQKQKNAEPTMQVHNVSGQREEEKPTALLTKSDVLQMTRNELMQLKGNVEDVAAYLFLQERHKKIDKATKRKLRWLREDVETTHDIEGLDDFLRDIYADLDNNPEYMRIKTMLGDITEALDHVEKDKKGETKLSKIQTAYIRAFLLLGEDIDTSKGYQDTVKQNITKELFKHGLIDETEAKNYLTMEYEEINEQLAAKTQGYVNLDMLGYIYEDKGTFNALLQKFKMFAGGDVLDFGKNILSFGTFCWTQMDKIAKLGHIKLYSHTIDSLKKEGLNEKYSLWRINSWSLSKLRKETEHLDLVVGDKDKGRIDNPFLHDLLKIRKYIENKLGKKYQNPNKINDIIYSGVVKNIKNLREQKKITEKQEKKILEKLKMSKIKMTIDTLKISDILLLLEDEDLLREHLATKAIGRLWSIRRIHSNVRLLKKSALSYKSAGVGVKMLKRSFESFLDKLGPNRLVERYYGDSLKSLKNIDKELNTITVKFDGIDFEKNLTERDINIFSKNSEKLTQAQEKMFALTSRMHELHQKEANHIKWFGNKIDSDLQHTWKKWVSKHGRDKANKMMKRKINQLFKGSDLSHLLSEINLENRHFRGINDIKKLTKDLHIVNERRLMEMGELIRVRSSAINKLGETFNKQRGHLHDSLKGRALTREGRAAEEALEKISYCQKKMSPWGKMMRISKFALPMAIVGSEVYGVAKGDVKIHEMMPRLGVAAAGFVPILGTAMDFKEAWSGRSMYDGKKLTSKEKTMAWVSFGLGAVADALSIFTFGASQSLRLLRFGGRTAAHTGDMFAMMKAGKKLAKGIESIELGSDISKSVNVTSKFASRVSKWQMMARKAQWGLGLGMGIGIPAGYAALTFYDALMPEGVRAIAKKGLDGMGEAIASTYDAFSAEAEPTGLDDILAGALGDISSKYIKEMQKKAWEEAGVEGKLKNMFATAKSYSGEFEQLKGDVERSKEGDIERDWNVG